MKVLTKSNFLYGLQCPKYLWIAVNDKSKLPKMDESAQFRIDQGQLIGDYAKQLYPDGISVPTDYIENLTKTKELLQNKKTLFEPGFVSDKFYARSDILVPVGEDQWDLIEVKSTTAVKSEHIPDVSFQRMCLVSTGLKVRKCFLMHLNKDYVRNDKIDTKKLLVADDITAELEDQSMVAEQLHEVLRLNQYPDIDIGAQCHNPRDCPLIDLCWKGMPKNNVFDLYRGGKKSSELYQTGVIKIKDIPADTSLTDKQNIQRVCEHTGKPHIELPWLKKFMNSIEYPVHYLDFETFSTAVPMYDGLHPYGKVPFQFSLHLDNGKNVEHISFLADGKSDPRKDFIAALKKSVSETGSIVVYNKSFELGVLEELGELFPEYKPLVKSISARVVDLLDVFRDFHYYDKEQQGSASIKNVLPALTGRRYDDMEISHGDAASLAFLQIMDKSTSENERSKLRKDLEDYCSLDTEGMVLILNKLKEIIK